MHSEAHSSAISVEIHIWGDCDKEGKLPPPKKKDITLILSLSILLTMIMKIRHFTLTVLGIRFKEAELHLSVLMQNDRVCYSLYGRQLGVYHTGNSG